MPLTGCLFFKSPGLFKPLFIKTVSTTGSPREFSGNFSRILVAATCAGASARSNQQKRCYGFVGVAPATPQPAAPLVCGTQAQPLTSPTPCAREQASLNAVFLPRFGSVVHNPHGGFCRKAGMWVGPLQKRHAVGTRAVVETPRVAACRRRANVASVTRPMAEPVRFPDKQRRRRRAESPWGQSGSTGPPPASPV